jgi:hypothetical protein
MSQPVCLVRMPSGTRTAPAGKTIDFDSVFSDLLAPAIREAGLQPVREDAETSGGVISQPMYERLMLCEFAIVDVSIPDASADYMLGVRQATRPGTTLAVYHESAPLPFDAPLMRTSSYATGADGRPALNNETRFRLTRMLTEANQRRGHASPVFQRLDWRRAGDVEHSNTDDWAERMPYSEAAKVKLREARRVSIAAVRQVESGLGDLAEVEAGILIDLLLSYRQFGTHEAWTEVVRLIERFPEPVRRSPLVQQQRAWALNRIGEGEAAEAILTHLIAERGPSSETNALLGRVYKDRFRQARDAGQHLQAQQALTHAVDAYLQGFESDWRDAYPGVNAVTLMELQDDPDARQAQLLPVVRYAVERRIAAGRGNYWDYATLIELAVLAGKSEQAADALSRALACTSENNRFSRRTTAENLRDIQSVRAARGRQQPGLKEIIDRLATYESR